MPSLVERIQDVRHAATVAIAAPPLPAIVEPAQPASAAAENTSVYVPPEPAKPAEAAPANDVMSYLLNPPLPSRGTTQDEGPAPTPRKASATTRGDARKPEAPKAAPATKPLVPRAKPTLTIKSIPRLEAIRMKSPQVIYARVSKTEPVHAARMPDPEGSLAWLQFLARSVHPGALHLLLAYYKRLGWIPSGAYGWLRDLCDGVARQSRSLTWESLRITPDKLVKIHAQSYRWLKAMFPAPVAASTQASNGHGAVVVKKTNAARRA